MRIDIRPFWTFGLGFYMEDNRAAYSGSVGLILLLLFFGIKIELNRKRDNK